VISFKYPVYFMISLFTITRQQILAAIQSVHKSARGELTSTSWYLSVHEAVAHAHAHFIMRSRLFFMAMTFAILW